MTDQEEVKRILRNLLDVIYEVDLKNGGTEVTQAATMFFGIALAMVKDYKARDTMMAAAVGYAIRSEEVLKEVCDN